MRVLAFLLGTWGGIRGDIPTQPDRWEPVNSDHEYFATKSILNEGEKNANQETEFLQFYYSASSAGDGNPQEIFTHYNYKNFITRKAQIVQIWGFCSIFMHN